MTHIYIKPSSNQCSLPHAKRPPPGGYVQTLLPVLWLRNGAAINRVGSKYVARNLCAPRIVEISGTICERPTVVFIRGAGPPVDLLELRDEQGRSMQAAQ